MDQIILEVCCGSADDVVEAERGGADRVELNGSIFFGGLTPTLGSLIEAKKRASIPVVVMIRPRGGGFAYTEAEFESMLHDTRLSVEHGADGIVFGILHEDGSIDQKRCEQLIQVAGQTELIFHRAIDVVPDLFASLDVLVDLGIQRVLTTGQGATIDDGLDTIKDMVTHVGDRLEIMPGGGTPHNVKRLVDRTACRQVHMASFQVMHDPSTLAQPHITYGFSLFPPEDRYELTNSRMVAQVKARLTGR